ncbi:uncharacterized protein V6R79_011745 [Siganus canaliculatus]
MAGASDPLEDMLFSEVDEKAVSDLVGSLESQLAGQSNPAGKTDENGGAGSVAPANHHLGKTLPAPVGTTTLEQQQQGRRNKPEMRPEINSKDASPDKTVTSPSLGCSPSFGEPSTTSAAGVNATSSGLQSHRASITTLAASGVSTLASTPGSISITSSCKGCKVNPSAGEATSAEASPPRKRISTPRRNASARIKSLNGAAVMTRRNSNAAVAENVSTGDPGATTPNSTRPVTSSINTSTFTLSNANLPVGQSAIALDRGTPTIALHRLPNHIVASIAQNGNGTSVSALVQQQGTRIGPITSTAPQENHGKTITDTGASKTDDCHSKIVMSSQSGGVNSVINTVPPAHSVVTPTTTTAAATTTTTVTQPLSSTTAAAAPPPPPLPPLPSAAAAAAVTGVATSSACGTGQTTSVTTTLSMVRPTAPSPTPAVGTTTQSQPRPGLTAPQRIVAPQLIVRPPQQQTTIQLPPGFTIPPGMVLVRTELGQLVMVPQQALAQVQAQAQAQNNISPRPATPTTGASFRVTTPQGIKTPGVVGGQVRMPVVITQSVRAQGAMGKGAVIQAGKSPMGLAVQISGNQKNKLNDPGGGSFRDDDDINDVASMAGVNLNEESARILATNSELVGTQIRSCKDEAFLHPGLLHRRILETAKKFGVTEVPMEAVTFISHATQSRLRTVVEKVSIIAQHRLDSCKDDECYEQSADVRSQLRFFEQLERMEKQRKDEQEREILLKAAKSRSRQEDPEQARLKQKAKEMQQQELAQMRQRDANLTALAAIGPRKKRKVDSPGTTPSGTEVSGSTAGSLSSPSTPSTSSRQYTRQRITRVNLRDLIFYMEQERETAHSLLLYRALLK